MLTIVALFIGFTLGFLCAAILAASHHAEAVEVIDWRHHLN